MEQAAVADAQADCGLVVVLRRQDAVAVLSLDGDLWDGVVVYAGSDLLTRPHLLVGHVLDGLVHRVIVVVAAEDVEALLAFTH